MTETDFERKWPALKEQLKKQYPELTEEDLIYEAGRKAELVKRLQQKTNKTEREIQEWLHFMG